MPPPAAYFLPYLYVGATLLGWSLGGGWNFLAIAFALGLVPLGEAVLGRLRSSAPGAPVRNSWAYRLPTWLWPPVQFALLVWALHAIGTEQATLLEAIGLALAVGTCTGAVGITLAHELIHRRHRAERLLGEALLVSVTYHHFTVEHVDGHHRRVATPHDPVSAPLGRSVYRALPRAIGGSFVSAWRLEGARLARRGRPFWSLRNRVLAGVLAEIALYGAIGAVFGGWAALFMAGQSLYAVIELEFVNYIEHYGLERRETAPGVYEPVAARHSWDSDRRLNAWLLFNLPRHADHHLHPGRRYEELVLLGAAPRLPSGYAGSTLLALVPPLWFRMVDPRARAANAA